MRLFEVTEKTSILLRQLLEVWESSVKATHLFLSDDEIAAIKRYVPQALREIPHLIVAENETGGPVGFMGIADRTIEMLFVSNAERGKGIGKRLITCGMHTYGANMLAVNEQNPLAKGFYEHMGFRVYQRTACDAQGNPYPLLYMKRD